MPRIGQKDIQTYIQGAITELLANGRTEIIALGRTTGTALIVSTALKQLGYPRISKEITEELLPARIRQGENWVEDQTRTHEVLGIKIVHAIPKPVT